MYRGEDDDVNILDGRAVLEISIICARAGLTWGVRWSMPYIEHPALPKRQNGYLRAWRASTALFKAKPTSFTESGPRDFGFDFDFDFLTLAIAMGVEGVVSWTMLFVGSSKIGMMVVRGKCELGARHKIPSSGPMRAVCGVSVHFTYAN